MGAVVASWNSGYWGVSLFRLAPRMSPQGHGRTMAFRGTTDSLRLMTFDYRLSKTNSSPRLFLSCPPPTRSSIRCRSWLPK